MVQLGALVQAVETKTTHQVRMLREFIEEHANNLASTDAEIASLLTTLDEAEARYQGVLAACIQDKQHAMQAQAENMLGQMTQLMQAFTLSNREALNECQQLGRQHLDYVHGQTHSRVQSVLTGTHRVRDISQTSIQASITAHNELFDILGTSAREIAEHGTSAAARANEVQQNVGEKRRQLETTVSGLTESVSLAMQDSCTNVAVTSAAARAIVTNVADATSRMRENTNVALESFAGFMDQHGDVLQDTLHGHFEQLEQQLHAEAYTIHDLKQRNTLFKTQASTTLQPTGNTPRPKEFGVLTELR